MTDDPAHALAAALVEARERVQPGIEGPRTYEMLLGPHDPGHPTWIDTGGLLQGIVSIRCLLPEQRHLPDVEVFDLS